APASSAIATLSLHDALPILDASGKVEGIGGIRAKIRGAERAGATIFVLPMETCKNIGDFRTDLRLVPVDTLKDAIAALQLIKEGDRKSTRLNSSHVKISYAV